MPWRNNPYLAIHIFNQTKADALVRNVCIRCGRINDEPTDTVYAHQYFQNALCRHCSNEWFEQCMDSEAKRIAVEETNFTLEIQPGILLSFEALKDISKSISLSQTPADKNATTFLALRLNHLLKAKLEGRAGLKISQLLSSETRHVSSIGGRETQLASARWLYWASLFIQVLQKSHPGYVSNTSLERMLLFPEVVENDLSINKSTLKPFNAQGALFRLNLKELDLLAHGIDVNAPPVRWTEIISGQTQSDQMRRLTLSVTETCLEYTRALLRTGIEP